MTVEEIELVWKWLESDALSREAADILKLELLLGARCGEISGLRAEEIDRNKWVWTLPASRSKNGRQRVTPIVGLARDMLERKAHALRAWDERLKAIVTGEARPASVVEIPQRAV